MPGFLWRPWIIRISFCETSIGRTNRRVKDILGDILGVVFSIKSGA
jgi:hypothetical protein